MSKPYLTTKGEKQETRELFAKHILANKKVGRCPLIFLLPGEEALDVKVINDLLSKEARIFGVERDAKAAHQLFENAQTITNFFPQQKTIEQFTETFSGDKFDAIWFDFLGGLTIENIQTVIDFLLKQCNINTKITLALTLLKTDRYREDEIKARFDELKSEYTGDKFATANNFAGFIASEITHKIDMRYFEPKVAMEYKSTTKSSPMIFVIFECERRS